MHNDSPKWQKELANFKGVKNTFVLEGNVCDMYPWYPEDDGTNGNLPEFCYLETIVKNIFDLRKPDCQYDFQMCDPLFGFKNPQLVEAVRDADIKTSREVLSRNVNIMDNMNNAGNGAKLVRYEAETRMPMVRYSEIIRVSMTENLNRGKDIVNIINYSSRFLLSADRISPDESAFFLNLLYASNNAARKSTLVIIVNKLNDLPAWFFINNPKIRAIAIPPPDRNTRKAFTERYIKEFCGHADARARFLNSTEGLKIIELFEIRKLKGNMKEPIDEIQKVVSLYKYGVRENKWEQICGDFEGKDIAGEIEKRVKGQSEAVNRIARVIKRAVVGMSGLQHSSDTKPRGILFLAGPTGTGKTEVVKTVTELLFGDEKALIRFDMSEYSSEHADQKLFGAPPGYIGYESGGQLTNAVKANPFSVLLFDEIEKAHHTIMDKFLQILEDGRMTDGQGNTVYFSETLLFFTSNCLNLEERFKPEVINRIGRNIIMFDSIGEEATQQILRTLLIKISENLRNEKRILVTTDESAVKHLYKICMSGEVSKFGGRGIGNVVEEQYQNVLSEYIFDNRLSNGAAIRVTAGPKKLVCKTSPAQ